jgi:tetratricopeptide (TPR) repeat protein
MRPLRLDFFCAFWVAMLVCRLTGWAESSAATFQENAQQKSAVLLEGLGSLQHPVSTKNPEAQKFFDQGLRLIFAFNHDEAHRAFQRAAELDPQLAMAFWGMALAVGPNYNLDAEDSPLKAAYGNIQKALALAKDGPEHERHYVEALSKRYVSDPKQADKQKLALAYKNAMGELSKRYPDDLDAATLYAESAMNLRPWALWTKDGKPAEGTLEIIAVLESVLRRIPDHTGANHYLIHAVEASPQPERALAAADRLRGLAPKAGHLVHMPSHIYIRIGDFEAAARANEKAAAVDHAYITRWDIKGIYPMMYYSHNLHFLAVANAMQGRYTDAKEAADKLADHVGPHVGAMPMLEAFLPLPVLVQLRFQRWEDILAGKAPDSKLTIVRSIWHYARGRALVARTEVIGAKEELAAVQKLHQAMPDDLKHGPLNSAKKVMAIAALALEAKIAVASKDQTAAVALLEKAIQIEDDLSYTEPADWWQPVRELLGATYLGMGKPAEAEKVFRADLEKNRRNPRSLFGLMESLKAQGQAHAASLVEQEFQSSWRNAEGLKLRVQDW